MQLNFTSINEATLLGYVTAEPTTKFTNSGTQVTTFNLATNNRQKNKESGEWEDVPTFHRVVLWSKLAEWHADKIKKGTRLHIVGRINNRKYQDDNDVTKYISEIVAENVINLSPSPKKGGNAPTQGELEEVGVSDEELDY